MPRRFANSNARARVSKDEDGRAVALMLRDASQRIWGAEAPALASRCDAPQHEGERARAFWRNEANCHFGETNPTSGIWPSVVPAKAGTHDHRRWLWVPALAPLGRDDDRLVRAKDQPAAVRNGGRGKFIVSGLLFTMNGATPTCRAGKGHMSPTMWHHPSSSPCVTIRRHNVFWI